MQTKPYPVGATFDMDIESDIHVRGYEPDPNDPGYEHIPEIEPDYRHHQNALRDLLAWWTCTINGMIECGFLYCDPQGSVKTTGILQAAARLNIPCLEVSAHEHMDLGDLVGRMSISNGKTVFRDGPLVTAARNGWWFVLDRADALAVSEQFALSQVMTGQPFKIPETGEVIVPETGFRFLATVSDLEQNGKDFLRNAISSARSHH